jgi:hypothetical protein
MRSVCGRGCLEFCSGLYKLHRVTSLPSWFAWPIEISPHATRRMPVRGFTEIDVRGMLDTPIEVIPDACPGRYLARCLWVGRRWDVILEPDDLTRIVIVVTAYSPASP